MRALALSLALLLAACGGGGDQNGDAQAAERSLAGQFAPTSDATRAAAGELSIQRGGLIFEKGVVLYTRTLDPPAAHDRIARDGASYAALAAASGAIAIELRRITDVVVAHDAAPLCAGDRPGYAALIQDQRSQRLTLLLFAGDTPPGQRAAESTLCATFSYAAHNPAPQGVVLR